jgi:hypothetical protein
LSLLLALVLMGPPMKLPEPQKIVLVFPVSCFDGEKLKPACGAQAEESCARMREKHRLPDAKCVVLPEGASK